jgi:cytochrome c peroxidase
LALGKALFFETQLSADGKTSCASCHKPEFWFSDSIALSKSVFSDTVTLRNTPPIFNLAWKKAFFWDGGVKNLESLSFAPLQSHLEMRADMKAQIPILNKRVQYKALAHEAYHTDTLNSQLIGRAIAVYLRSIISYNSRWDSVQLKKTQFTPYELKGEVIFNRKCKTCHIPPLFLDGKYHNIFLDKDTLRKDRDRVYYGRYRISWKKDDIYAYSTPSLRNWAFTAPYMHDGRIKTMEEVLEFYRSGCVPILSLKENEKGVLLAYLNTLNDYSILKTQKSGK